MGYRRVRRDRIRADCARWSARPRIDASGGHVWAERWDRDLNDIFALQDEISEAIVKALKLKLLPEEKQAIERRDTQSAEAYELFLLARQFERTGSERVKPLIVRICDRCIELDPGFARAYALGIGRVRAECGMNVACMVVGDEACVTAHGRREQ